MDVAAGDAGSAAGGRVTNFKGEPMNTTSVHRCWPSPSSQGDPRVPPIFNGPPFSDQLNVLISLDRLEPLGEILTCLSNGMSWLQKLAEHALTTELNKSAANEPMTPEMRLSLMIERHRVIPKLIDVQVHPWVDRLLIQRIKEKLLPTE